MQKIGGGLRIVRLVRTPSNDADDPREGKKEGERLGELIRDHPATDSPVRGPCTVSLNTFTVTFNAENRDRSVHLRGRGGGGEWWGGGGVGGSSSGCGGEDLPPGFKGWHFENGFVFKCSDTTIDEVHARSLFGAERRLWTSIIQSVSRGTTALFLYNYR